MSHSPLPWKIEPLTHYEDCEPKGLKITASNGETIADDQTYYPWAISKENAIFIVKACNNHAKLLEALRIALNCANDGGSIDDVTKEKIEALIEQC